PEKAQEDVIEPLGLRDRKVVAQAVDILVVFGIQPRMHAGVGIPLSLRVRSEAAAVMTKMLQRQSKALMEHWTQENRELEKQPGDSVSLAQMARRLAHIVESKISWGTADVAHILVNKYTPDIFALLMQTAYAPIPPATVAPPAGYLETIETDSDRRIELQRAFTRMFQETNVFLLLETLTSLLNAAVTYKPQSKWFCTLCSRFLTRIMLRPGGVRIAVDFFMSNDTEVTAEKLDRIANLVLAAPGTMDQKEYLARVAPQLIEIIESHAGNATLEEGLGEDVIGKMMNTEAVRERVLQAAVYIVRKMAEKYQMQFRDLVARPINQPLMRWFTTRTVVAEPLLEDSKTPTDESLAVEGPVLRGLQQNSRQRQTRPLIQVVQRKEKSSGDSADQPVVSSAVDLSKALAALRTLVLDGVSSSTFLNDLVVPVFAPLLYWLAAEEPQGQTKQTILSILVAVLRQMPSHASVSTVLSTIQLVRADTAQEKKTIDWAVFSPIGRDGPVMQMVWHSQVADTATDAATEIESQELVVPVDALLDVLASSELRDMLGDLFVTLLREQQAMLELLDQQGPKLINEEHILRKWWLVSQVTLSMVDRFGASLLTRHQDILAFIFDTLERTAPTLLHDKQKASSESPSIEVLVRSLSLETSDKPQTPDRDNTQDVEERVGAAELGVLALMLLGHVMAVSERQAFSKMAPGLAQQLDPDAPSDSLPPIDWDDLALRHLRGIQAQLDRLQNADSTIKNAVSQVKTQVSMILALNGASSGPATSSGSTAEGQERTDDVQRFIAALRDVRSPLVPVQAHGVLELRNLVLSRSPILTTDRVDAAVNVFLEMLASDDTYLHLNAIRGLSALTDTSGDRFIPQLISLYTSSQSLDECLRIGEALLQTVHRAGKMLAHYAPVIVPALIDTLQNDHEEEEEMRKYSALSILSMCAQVDALGLHRWVDLITTTLDDLLAVEQQKAPLLRRAAVMFWLSLVRGYGDRVRALIDRKNLLTMYRALRLVADTDTDEIAQLNAQLAIEELDDNVKDQLFSKFL
ncbi:hypothetical protein LPJ64_005764, partial [Coemansia asiatica]